MYMYASINQLAKIEHKWHDGCKQHSLHSFQDVAIATDATISSDCWDPVLLHRGRHIQEEWLANRQISVVSEQQVQASLQQRWTTDEDLLPGMQNVIIYFLAISKLK